MKIKNWPKFQHFKDRRPPWIKLYRELLDDKEFHDLDAEAAKTLVLLWLLASEDPKQEGNLPTMADIGWRLRISEKRLKDSISKLSHWLEQVDITLISERYQADAPEERRDTTTEETDISASGDAASVKLLETVGCDAGCDPSPGELAGRFVQWWNQNADSRLARCRQLTDSRRRRIIARLKEHPDRKFWELVMAKINGSQFLRGLAPNKRWKVDIDFIIHNETNAVRIAEGSLGGDQHATVAPDLHDNLAVHG
jgi:hypothetical protein